MDGGDLPAPVPARKSLLRSSSFTHRSSVPAPPPLSISRPCLVPHLWPNAPRPDSDPDSGSASRRGQLAFFDRECSRIEDHLYLGSDLIARDIDALRRHGITHVLSCVGSPELFRPELTYKTLWLSDTPAQDITSVLYDVFDYFEEVRCGGGGKRVLVHCSRGVSRSAALVVAYLMWRHDLPFDVALRRVRNARPVTDPNLGFASQLLSLQTRILSSSETPSSTFTPNSRCRFYRMAPQSPYDPLHLVPKSLDRHPSISDLDSRGAFVVHVPSTVYVWIGSNCDQAMTRSARSAACQVVRYERAAGPIVPVDEGSEPSGFWSAFGNCLGQLSVVGTKRVEAYDLDFEIFLRAIRGGVVPPFIPPSVRESPTRLPAKEGGWGRLRQRFISGGVKDLVSCCSVPLLEDREMEPFGSPQSSFSRDSSTPRTSDFSSMSPASSSSDWCNSPSGSELYYEGEPLLALMLSPRERKSSPPLDATCLGYSGGKVVSSQAWLPPADREDAHGDDVVRDWPFSPLSLAVDEGGGTTEIEHLESCDANNMAIDEEKNTVETLEPLIQPSLFRWPNLEKMENLHPGVLDSKSLFLLLASDSSLEKCNSKILYVWVGGQSQFANENGSGGREVNVFDQLQKIGADFLDQFNFCEDVPIQIIREEEEPTQFLNHLFTFHQSKEKNHS